MNTLQDRANENVLREGLDYSAWPMVDLCREYTEETGEDVTPGDMACAMLDHVEAGYRDDLANLTQDDDGYENVERHRLTDEIKNIQHVTAGIECAERGEYVYRSDVRALLAEWGVRALCRGCQGGRAALCSECQARVLPAALSASVAVYSGTPTAVLPPRPVSLVPLRRAQPYPPSDDLETVRPAHDDVA